MGPKRPILIVEDDVVYGPRLCKIIKAPTILAATAARAREALDDRVICGAIVDLLLPDGSGLDVVAEKRPDAPYLPILLMTAVCDPGVVNRVYDLGIEYVCKPATGAQLMAFVARTDRAESLHEPDARRLTEAFALRHELTERETAIVALSVVGKKRELVAVELAISENTLKNHIKSILLKSGERSLEAIARRLREGHFARPIH